MSRAKETRRFAEDIDSPDDRESLEFDRFKDDVRRCVKRLKTATIRAIKEDFARRNKRMIVMCALARLEADKVLHAVCRGQWTEYVWGAEKTSRSLPRRHALTHLFDEKVKNDFVNLGVLGL